MAISRNARRLKSKARLLEKSERIAKAELGRVRDAQDRIVKSNLSAPRERNYYPESNIGKMALNAPRAYICRAGGQMGHSRTEALKIKANKSREHYVSHDEKPRTFRNDEAIRADIDLRIKNGLVTKG